MIHPDFFTLANQYSYNKYFCQENGVFDWSQIIYSPQITVTDDEGNAAEFPCNDWLSDTQGGGKLERELIRKLEKTVPKKV